MTNYEQPRFVYVESACEGRAAALDYMSQVLYSRSEKDQAREFQQQAVKVVPTMFCIVCYGCTYVVQCVCFMVLHGFPWVVHRLVKVLNVAN